MCVLVSSAVYSLIRHSPVSSHALWKEANKAASSDEHGDISCSFSSLSSISEGRGDGCGSGAYARVAR